MLKASRTLLGARRIYDGFQSALPRPSCPQKIRFFVQIIDFQFDRFTIGFGSVSIKAVLCDSAAAGGTCVCFIFVLV